MIYARACDEVRLHHFDYVFQKHIFCNRPLNMKNIVVAGFDMDYTLAQYKPEGTIKKLVYDLGYPSEVCPIWLATCWQCLFFFLE